MNSTDSDSNALILPATSKKKPKNKPKPQLKLFQDKKVSKSHTRKLKKLEEDKEKEKLLAKSLKTLEKCTIRDDMYSLLKSSEKIGQMETRREKLWREMQFSKAGLEIPENQKHPKRKEVCLSENDVDEDEISQSGIDLKATPLKPLPVQNDCRNDTSAISAPCPLPSLQHGIGDGTVPNELIIESIREDDSQVEKLDSSSALISKSPISATVAHRFDDSKEETYDGARCTSSDNLERPLMPPTVIYVSRPEEVENGRKDLPIIMMEQEIMEAINNHTTVIICGETGCGKTTQVPQFLYEAGYGSRHCSMRGGVIGVTQPRRVAVLSTARRVAYELGVRLGKEVGFQVRHDKRIGENSSIKFMTDGILLRELQGDMLLKRYSVLILDEAHERSLNTDILIGMLSRVIVLRQNEFELQQQKVRAGVEIALEERIYPLKLILMSATLRVEDFSCEGRIFKKSPPVIEIPTRQYPVTRHFARRTELVDYIGEAYKTVLKIHKNLPPGGILVFVTGQKEVEDLCRKLRQALKQFKKEKVEADLQNATTVSDLDQINGDNTHEIDQAFNFVGSSAEEQTDRFSCYDECHDAFDIQDSDPCDISRTESELDFDSDDEDNQETFNLDDNTVDVSLDSLHAAFEALAGKTPSKSQSNWKEISDEKLQACSKDSSGGTIVLNKGEKSPNVGPLHVLPLYAMLPAAAQLRVFKEVAVEERLVVVATNVAETSLTIPGIKYVVDTGREKVKLYNSSNGMESYNIQWISKASAAQRAGRAGRTGPGHCYCLYSSAALTNEFPEFSCAEILKTPVDGVVLLLKSMHIKTVTGFPFPTPPDAADLAKALKCLRDLEALDTEGKLTSLGKAMAQYPMGPRHSKLLLFAVQIIKEKIKNRRQDLVLGYAVAVASALSLSNPFISLSVASEITETMQDPVCTKPIKKEVKENRGKLFNLKSDALSAAYALQCFEQSKDTSKFCNDYALSLKTLEEMSKLRKQILQLVFNQRFSGVHEEFSLSHGGIENVEDRWSIPTDRCPLEDAEEDFLCQAICAGWPDRVARQLKGTKLSVEGDRKVNAVRYQAPMVSETVFLRRWSSISRAAPEFLVYHEMQHTKRPYINAATKVKPEWLVKCAGSLCTLSAQEDPKPFYDGPTDQVFRYVIPHFLPLSCDLPLSKVVIEDVHQRVAVFAVALLDGKVLPCINEVKSFLASRPTDILQRHSLGQKRVSNLLCSLRFGSVVIDSCANLREVWKAYPNHLHSEIREWFQQKFHHQFEEVWTQMHREVLISFPDRFPERAERTKRRKTY